MAKTTFRVDRKRWDMFNRECKASFLRRDAYLNHILPGEIQILEQLPPNNDAAHQWLKSRWFGQHGQLRTDVTDFVSAMLDKPLIERLNQACDERNIPRDAFVHCVLMFLTERLIEAVLVIKNPRTTSDTFSKVAEVCYAVQDDEDDERGEDETLFDTKLALLSISSTIRARNLEPLRQDYYQRELSFPPKRLAEQKAVDAELEELLQFSEPDEAQRCP